MDIPEYNSDSESDIDSNDILVENDPQEPFTFNGLFFDSDSEAENILIVDTLDINEVADVRGYVNTILMIATIKRHHYLVEHLVERGANLNIRNYHGFSAIEYSKTSSMVKYFIEHGAYVTCDTVPCECCTKVVRRKIFLDEHLRQKSQYSKILFEVLDKKFIGPEVFGYLHEKSELDHTYHPDHGWEAQQQMVK